MIEFLLVVIVTVVLAICVSPGQGGRRRVGIVVAAFAAWMILPSIILQANWGYYDEGGSFGSTFLEEGPSSEAPARKAARLAAGVCGDAGGFEVEDRSVYFTAVDEHKEAKHFFYYSKVSDVSWVGVGWGQSYCLARYHISLRRSGELVWFPNPLFPVPFFRWITDWDVVDARFVERVPTPKSPDGGLFVLLPGQCTSGEVPKGESRRFQVEMPGFARRVELVTHFLCYYGDDIRLERAFEWTRDGRPLGQGRTTHGGGVYQVTLHAPQDEDMAYNIAIASPDGLCPPIKRWDEYVCEPNPDPNDRRRSIRSRAKRPRAPNEDD